jgi:sugar O-acyltransferase (sialic acid O-acetyltransferase NeuD family)
MSLPKVYIVGAGGFGREVFTWASHHPDCGKKWEITGFLDDNAEALSGMDSPGKVVGPITLHSVEPQALYLCGLGQPEQKIKICTTLKKSGACFLTLVHPTCTVGQSVFLGEGVVLCPNVVLTCDITLGDFVMFNTHATAGHDVKVGAYSSVSSFCDLTGGVELGESVFLASRVTVVPGRKIGNGAYVGAGSVVIQNVSPGQRVFGVPARPL